MKNERIADIASSIAESANHWVVIKNGTLSLVNRNQDNASVYATYTQPDLIELSISVAMPIRSIRASWTQNRPYSLTNKLSKESRQVKVEISSYGRDLEVEPLSTVESEAKAFVSSYYQIEKRPQSTAKLAGILDLEIGYRIVCFDSQNEVESNITIASISYDFEAETTSVSGHSQITHRVA